MYAYRHKCFVRVCGWPLAANHLFCRLHIGDTHHAVVNLVWFGKNTLSDDAGSMPSPQRNRFGVCYDWYFVCCLEYGKKESTDGASVLRKTGWQTFKQRKNRSTFRRFRCSASSSCPVRMLPLAMWMPLLVVGSRRSPSPS